MSDASTPSADAPRLELAELVAWLRRSGELLAENSAELNELDAAIGDADHGTNMRRGFDAVVAALTEASDAGSPHEDVGSLMKAVGMTLVSRVGGASGPLYGTFFLRLGTTAEKGATGLDGAGLLAALEAGVGGIEQRGKATTGEKTMLDAWKPALDAARDGLAAGGLACAVRDGAAAAAEGRDATRDLEATKGRASYLGERSIGHLDPGATSTALIWQALAETVAGAGA